MKEIYKGYEIRLEAGGILKSIRGVGKGSIPMTLSGLYTSSLDAMRAIDLEVGGENKSNGKATQ